VPNSATRGGDREREATHAVGGTHYPRPHRQPQPRATADWSSPQPDAREVDVRRPLRHPPLRLCEHGAEAARVRGEALVVADEAALYGGGARRGCRGRVERPCDVRLGEAASSVARTREPDVRGQLLVARLVVAEVV